MPTELRPTVSVVSGLPVVSSLHVAEHFEKQHKSVLRAVATLKSELGMDSSERNFAPAEYLDEQKKPRPAYNLTRDGFTLLAMGFTGKKALAWKVKYIEAFNAMESELRAREDRKSRSAQPEQLDDYGLPLRPFFTVKQVANILCLNPDTIHKWLVQHPELPVHQQSKRSNILVSRVDLLRWLRDCRKGEAERAGLGVVEAVPQQAPTVPADIDPCLFHLAEVVWKMQDVDAASERLFDHMERKHSVGQRGGHTFRNLAELRGVLKRGLQANMEAIKLVSLVTDCARREFL